jgi:hypothetical protein
VLLPGWLLALVFGWQGVAIVLGEEAADQFLDPLFFLLVAVPLLALFLVLYLPVVSLLTAHEVKRRRALAAVGAIVAATPSLLLGRHALLESWSVAGFCGLVLLGYSLMVDLERP